MVSERGGSCLNVTFWSYLWLINKSTCLDFNSWLLRSKINLIDSTILFHHMHSFALNYDNSYHRKCYQLSLFLSHTHTWWIALIILFQAIGLGHKLYFRCSNLTIEDILFCTLIVISFTSVDLFNELQYM